MIMPEQRSAEARWLNGDVNGGGFLPEKEGKNKKFKRMRVKKIW